MNRLNYETGKQPCQNFLPARTGNQHAEWDNVHICIYCADSTVGLVSFCENCCKDHHFDGYESCDKSKQDSSGKNGPDAGKLGGD